MNVELLNPFGQNFPETVVSTLEDAALCVKYSPTGRFIAAGRYDGFVTVWDVETKGVIRSLEGHVKGIVSVSWSRNSKYLITASKDWNVVIWDLETGDRKRTVRFDTPLLGARFHPRNSKILLVTLASQQCFVVDTRLKKGSRIELTVRPFPLVNGNHATEGGQNAEEERTISDRKGSITVSRFSADGKTIWLGTSSGSVLIFSTRTKELLNTIKIANNCSIKHMEFDRSGSYLVLNSTERIVRVYAIQTSPYSDDEDEDQDQDQNETPNPNGQENGNDAKEEKKLKEEKTGKPQALPALDLLHRLQDPIQKSPWNAVAFSGDGEYVLAGSANIASHGLYIWDRTTGDLEKILEGPKEPLSDLDWHPFRPHTASLAISGLIHLWGRHVTENYSAFAPGFEELDENIEYEEREDEFDIEDEEEERQKRLRVEEEEVDVDTVDPTTAPALAGSGRVSVTPGVVLAAPGQGDEDDAWADADADDDVQFDWYPPVRLEDEDDEDDF